MLQIQSNSIRQKLLNWLLILLLPLLLLGAGSAYYLAKHFAELAYDRALFRKALAIADQVEVRAGRVVVELPDSTLQLIEYDRDDWIYYQIQDADHHVLIGEKKLNLPKILPKAGNATYYDSALGNKSLRMVAFSLPLTGTSAKGNAMILIGETTAKRDDMAEEIVAVMLVPQVLLLILVMLLVNLGIRRGLISLENLRSLILQRQPSDTHPLDEYDAPQELQPLLHAMNELLVKVRGSVDERQQFIANAAHQLKTPLAGLKIQAETALREGDVDRVHHALKQISLGSDNLGRLVNQLLSLARAEPNDGVIQAFAEVDLVELVNEVTAEWVPKALAKRIDLGVSCPMASLKISGHAMLLQELLNNLIDNAIRYNAPKTKVTVGLEQIGNEVILSVQDNGAGLPVHEQQKVFERFYRVLGTAESGCGLGLAIVSEIAGRHHARVELGYSDVQHSTGTIVKVIFQRAGNY